MVALYVILALIIFLICLLFIDIKVTFCYKDRFFIKVKYLITLFDSDKKKIVEDNIKPSKKRNETISKLHKAKEIFGSFDSTIAFFKLLKELLIKFSKFLKKVKVYNTELELTVAGDDAATTAIKYGACCSVIYPTLTLFSNTTVFTPKRVNISSDFTSESFSVGIYTDISVKPIYVIKFAISLAFSYIKLRLERNRK